MGWRAENMGPTPLPSQTWIRTRESTDAFVINSWILNLHPGNNLGCGGGGNTTAPWPLRRGWGPAAYPREPSLPPPLRPVPAEDTTPANTVPPPTGVRFLDTK